MDTDNGAISLNLEGGERGISKENKTMFRWVLNGETIEDLTTVLEFDTCGCGVFLPYVGEKICLIPTDYNHSHLPDILDSMISVDSSLVSPSISTTTDVDTMSSVFSVSYIPFCFKSKHEFILKMKHK